MLATNANRETVSVEKNGHHYIATYSTDNIEGAIEQLMRLVATRDMTWWAVVGLRAEMFKRRKAAALQSGKPKGSRTG